MNLYHCSLGTRGADIEALSSIQAHTEFVRRLGIALCNQCKVEIRLVFNDFTGATP